MERKLKPIYVQQALREKKVSLFTPDEFRRIFSVSLRASQEFIKDHNDDLFLKLRNGLYVLRTDMPQEELIANKLYAPSYVSFEYAMSRYGLIPESVYTVTSATVKITREFTVNNKVYTYSHIKKSAYRGYLLEKINGSTILMASAEKALVDYLYFVHLKLKSLNERLNISKLKKKLVIEYASLFGRKVFLKFIRQIL
jgi:predicted transcriptional regulator of viral defense system